MEDKLIIDWLDSEADWGDIVNEIKDRCKLNSTEVIAMKIVSDFGYVRKDAHVPRLSVRYQITEDLYEDLDELCQCEDCKNGVQLYQESDGTYYFQITGANFYDKEDKYAGIDTVKIWFKDFDWRKL